LLVAKSVVNQFFNLSLGLPYSTTCFCSSAKDDLKSRDAVLLRSISHDITVV
jgi:hypothetical protein